MSLSNYHKNIIFNYLLDYTTIENYTKATNINVYTIENRTNKPMKVITDYESMNMLYSIYLEYVYEKDNDRNIEITKEYADLDKYKEVRYNIKLISFALPNADGHFTMAYESNISKQDLFKFLLRFFDKNIIESSERKRNKLKERFIEGSNFALRNNNDVFEEFIKPSLNIIK